MKNATLLFVLLPFFVVGQVDTAAVEAQVDSLISLAGRMMEENTMEMEEVHRLIDSTENLTIKKFGRDSELYGDICQKIGQFYFSKRMYEESSDWYLKAKKEAFNIGRIQ
ncbi:MAG: hypothetical protein H6559_34040 [Lewinellaceae bacterium]|nr:hypothetical protein [Lewinellaceae bacterium]